jgi:hypothetical protein
MENWGLYVERKGKGKMHEGFCKRIMGAPTAAASGACVKEKGRTNWKEMVLERALYIGSSY